MCDFESASEPMCSWSHDPSGDYQWRRIRGDQINNNWYDDYWQLYGPDRDHTLGNAERVSFPDE